jgi:competence protein ComGC
MIVYKIIAILFILKIWNGYKENKEVLKNYKYKKINKM